jgi:di/tricarboxylate transporter
MVLTFVILAITIVLFVWGGIRPDIVALLSLLALYLTGILDVGQTLAGFGNSTVIMIAVLFVVGDALSRTGVTAWLGEQLFTQAGQSKVRLLVVLIVGTALLSAFISNTGTVATLMPAVVSAAWSIGSLPSKFLIPLAYAANTGGLLTLVGTPPNIVVAAVLEEAGLRPFGFFEFALIGLPLLIATIIYMAYIGRRLLPSRESGDRPIDVAASVDVLAEAYSLQENLFQARVRRGSSLVGQTLREAGLGRDFGVSVVGIERAGSTIEHPHQSSLMLRESLEKLVINDKSALPGPDTEILADDLLWIKASQESIERLMVHFNLGIQPLNGHNDDPEKKASDELTHILLSHEIGVAEVLVAPRSAYVGRTLAQARISEKYNVQVLSVRRGEKALDQNRLKLSFGDSLLVRGTWEAIGLLQNEKRNFVVVGSPEAMARQVVEFSTDSAVAVTALLVMVGLMISGLVPTVIAALIAAVLMVLGGCLSMEQAYRAISWSSVILIAAMIPMSTALEVSGGANFLANGLVSTLGAIGPFAVMAGVFILTTGFSQVISNTATTVLMAPIVLEAALALDISPYALLIMVVVGASTAFLTPIASPPNTMVMAPGGYGFNDYLKVGLPLTIIFLVISLALVPLIWPI